MDRRRILRRLGGLVLGLGTFPLIEDESAHANGKSDLSPHAEAIAVVIRGQQKEIAQAEFEYFNKNGRDWWRGEPEQYWWHDTITRSWSSTRPFPPGVVDSTHFLYVVYSINGQAVRSWSVDTRKEKAELMKFDEIKRLPTS
jgi:hypothetical protein